MITNMFYDEYYHNNLYEYCRNLRSYATELAQKWVPNHLFKPTLYEQATSAMIRYLQDAYSVSEFLELHKEVHPECYI